MSRRTLFIALSILVVSTLSIGFAITWRAFIENNVYEYDPAWAPNGRKLVYVCYRPTLKDIFFKGAPYHGDIPYSPRAGEICIIDEDGRNEKQLTQNRAADNSPIWSPDGEQVAFLSSRGYSRTLFVIRPDGTGERQLARIGSDDIDRIAWSPDGHAVTFTRNSYAAGGNSGIFEVFLANGKVHMLFEGHVMDFAWSPDGLSLAIIQREADRCQLKVVKPESDTQLVNPVSSVCSGLAWSPDGKKVAFLQSQDRLQQKLLFLDIQTGDYHQLATGSLSDTITWFLDGNGILYATHDEIWMIRPLGSRPEIILDDPHFLDFLGSRSFVLSPSGKDIVFALRTDQDNAQLWRLNLRGMMLTPLRQ